MRGRSLGSYIYALISLIAQAQASGTNPTVSTTSVIADDPNADFTSATDVKQDDIAFSSEHETTKLDVWSSFRQSAEVCSLDDDRDLELQPQPESLPTLSSDSTAIPEAIETPEPFISFEEWKKIKQAEEDERDSQEAEGASETQIEEDSSSTSLGIVDSPTEVAPDEPKRNHSSKSSSNSSVASQHSKVKGKNDSNTSTSLNSSQQTTSSPPISSSSPAAVVYHHNRYNYASPDCSARIHSSSPQTQHASSLLHKSRDRYMLTPCKSKEHWVIIELCDEIRIEAVELSIWEFFSGVVREIRISVGGEDDEEFEDDPKDDVNGRSPKWKEVGSFVGKNVRGVQTFTLSQPTSFHRFIRLDFPSYYGTEYYCPVSQAKVYGMNQMEAFKWEQKRLSAASKGRNEAKEKEAEEKRIKEREEKEKKENDEKMKQHEREKELDALEKLLHEQAGRTVPDILTATAILSKFEETVKTKSSISAPSSTISTALINKMASASNASSQASGSASDHRSANSTTSSSPPTVQATTKIAGESSVSSSPSSTSSTTSSTYSRSPPPRSDSSESIYAFIIRRLNDLEGNSTLVARYIEEQAKVMRHMLTRVEKGWEDWKGDWEGEDRGRWEQERMRQEDRLGKIISQLEQQRSSFEEERKILQSQMRGLAEELGYERRRGLAQLFVMFIIIILGVISRSSTIDAVLKPLLAEAKRRRSIYGRKSFSGPLTGLKIDMGIGRPPAIIGQGRPKSLSDINDILRQTHQYNGFDRANSPTSPTPTNNTATSSNTPTNKTRSHNKSNSNYGSPRRSGTPTSSSLRQRRFPPGITNNNIRSVSATDQIPLSSSTSSTSIRSPIPNGHIHSNLLNPRQMGSSSLLSSSNPTPMGKPNAGGGGGGGGGNGHNGSMRKLAKSSHLHIIDTTDKQRKSKSSPKPQYDHVSYSSNSQNPRRSSQVFHNGHLLSSSPPTDEVSPFTTDDYQIQLPDQPSLDHPSTSINSDWATDLDVDTENDTEASVSEVEDNIEDSQNNEFATINANLKARNGSESDEMIKNELKEIWNPSPNTIDIDKSNSNNKQ
ncbi:uncharacterized protein L201_004058 [Kwoniella dendrophila CBS 6074]|uniref:SUN domain-containing protein n=1 Tax=Kwoniella dendrophila CBS 6074 TaxID=1295534 RepID=A0AAX4JUN3_9TREE